MSITLNSVIGEAISTTSCRGNGDVIVICLIVDAERERSG